MIDGWGGLARYPQQVLWRYLAQSESMAGTMLDTSRPKQGITHYAVSDALLLLHTAGDGEYFFFEV